MKKLDIIRTYYESNMGKGLPEYGILGWESEEAHRLRFDILASSIDMEGKAVLDVGCGTGSLLEYLRSRNINVGYTGVDILQSMVDHAVSKNLGADFYCMDIFKNNIFEKESFDIAYASGIFNLNLSNNREFLVAALKVLFELSREAVVFNLLHCGSPDKEEQYCYYDPDEVKQLIEQIPHKLKKVEIVEQYLQNDFTVICHKNR